MSARRKKTFKPILEALEDRCLLSTTPLTVQDAQAAVGLILQDVQQQLTTLQSVAGDLVLASQQAIFTAAAELTAQPFSTGLSQVFLESKTVNPSQFVTVRLGAVVYPKAYLDGHVPATASFRWQNPNFYNPNLPWTPANGLISFAVEPPSRDPKIWAQSGMYAQANIFVPKVPGTYFLEVKVDFHPPGQPVDSSWNRATITISYSAVQNGNRIMTDLQQGLTALQTIGSDLVLAEEVALATTAAPLSPLPFMAGPG